jgi:oxygen-independent coproporphyrinogen-3 oxidase
MDPHLLPFAERQAPRYTSYPSANHFDASVNAETYTRWVGALNKDARLSLYLHVPYCQQLCWYCGCNTFLTRGGDIDDFVATLMMEMDLIASKLDARCVEEVHWGGGTPNILSPAQFIRLVRHIDFWFDVSAHAAHAIELDPRYVTRELAAAYAAAGVTRVSLGVQDLNPHVQEAMGRVQPIEQVRRAVETLRNAGLAQLSFDLMYGLPGQTSGDIARTIRLATELQPSRIALFGYAHVPWFKRRQRLIDAQALPGVNDRFDQAELARRMLNDLGYESVGLDHFARPDDPLALSARGSTLKRNFQGYVARESNALIGLGPSAISHLLGGYVQNIATVRAWRSAVESNLLPVARGHAESADDLRRGGVIQSIMCQFEVDLRPSGGWDMFPDAHAELRLLAETGLLEIKGDVLRIPPAARPFARLVAMAFDAYGQPSQPAHARAI